MTKRPVKPKATSVKPRRESAVARMTEYVVAVRLIGLDTTVEMFAFPRLEDATGFAELAREMGAEAIVGRPINTGKGTVT